MNNPETTFLVAGMKKKPLFMHNMRHVKEDNSSIIQIAKPAVDLHAQLQDSE